MEKFLNRLERKFGRYAIHNLSLYIILAYVIGYILMFTGSMDFISLNPYYIMRGQIWRIVTWVLVPPSQMDLFTIVMLFFYYQIGNTLESTWGAFRYNLYIFSGILFSVIGALILYFITVANGLDPLLAGTIVSGGFSTYYINLSIFLAFAAVYPNMQVLLFFVIPVRMKWLGILDGVLLIYTFIASGASIRFAIIMSMLNFLLYFIGSRNYYRINPKEIHRRNQFKRATAGRSTNSGSGFSGFTSKANTSGISKHKCAICGRTEKDSDSLEFRFCSKCNGNYEYCSDHLFTHEHIK